MSVFKQTDFMSPVQFKKFVTNYKLLSTEFVVERDKRAEQTLKTSEPVFVGYDKKGGKSLHWKFVSEDGKMYVDNKRHVWILNHTTDVNKLKLVHPWSKDKQQ